MVERLDVAFIALLGSLSGSSKKKDALPITLRVREFNGFFCRRRARGGGRNGCAFMGLKLLRTKRKPGKASRAHSGPPRSSN